MWMTGYWIFGIVYVASVAAYIYFSKQHHKTLEGVEAKAFEASKK